MWEKKEKSFVCGVENWDNFNLQIIKSFALTFDMVAFSQMQKQHGIHILECD
jgi:hypothetical protein